MYMSPERGEEDVRVDSTADQYSLACVTFEMLSGRPPYRGATVAAVYAQHAVAKVPSIRKYRASVSQGVDDGLGRALAKKPSERFPSITAFTNAVTGRSDPEGIPPWDRVRGRYLDLMQRVREAPAGAAALLIGTVVLALTVPLGVDRILDRTGAYSVAEPRQSFVVVPTSTRAVDPEETVLATDVQHALIAQLNAWESPRAVPAISLLGPARDLDLPATGITSLEQGLALARAHRVGTLVTVDVTVRNDSAVVEVNLFDVAAATPIAEALISAESKQDPWALARPITFDILGISGAPEDLELLLTRSSLPAALRQFDEGVRALERWRLTEAEAHFREATAADSTFGLAHHYLALTIHWQVSQMVGPRGAVGRTGALRSEIRRATNEALRHARSLTRHDSTHIAALHAFHAGDYQHSRELYQELTRRDSSDAYAWLMLGTVEFSDPWLVSDTSGAVHPRQNLNIARRAFLRTTRFWPDFFLGYGHLFDIHGALSLGVLQQTCPVFHSPGADVLLPWEHGANLPGVPFCPVLTDSIEWIPHDGIHALDRQVVERAAERFLTDAVQQVGRWIDYAPDDPSALSAMTEVVLDLRRSLLGTTRPGAMDSLTVRAHDLWVAALASTADTTAEQRLRLGLLRLAVGDMDSADRLTLEGLGLLREPAGGVPPEFAANVLLARGRLADALDVLTAAWGDGRVTIRVIGPDGEILSFRESEPLLARLKVLGSMGVTGPLLQTEFERLELHWTNSSFSSRLLKK